MPKGPRRPRIHEDLAARVDAVRGDVPFERWVRRVLEQAVERQERAGVLGPDDLPPPEVTAVAREALQPERTPFVEALEQAPGPVERPQSSQGASSAPARAPVTPARRASGERVDPAVAARMAGLNKAKGL